MSININEKIANGETLSDDEIKYAVERGMALPDEYDVQVGTVQSAMDPTGRPYEPVAQTGPAYAQPEQNMGAGVFLTEEDLSSLDKATLEKVGGLVGADLSGTKAEMVDQLVGGGNDADDADEDQEDGQ